MTKVDYEGHAQLENGILSLKKMMNVEEERSDHIRSEMDSMKAEYKRRAEFHKKMDSMKSMRMKEAKECRAQAQKDIDSMKFLAV
jgi:hypothetical protein